VSITDDQGRQEEGRISTLSADRLTLVSRRDSTDVPYDRIVRVDRPRDGLHPKDGGRAGRWARRA
jgi:hypothetical protein